MSRTIRVQRDAGGARDGMAGLVHDPQVGAAQAAVAEEALHGRGTTRPNADHTQQPLQMAQLRQIRRWYGARQHSARRCKQAPLCYVRRCDCLRRSAARPELTSCRLRHRADGARPLQCAGRAPAGASAEPGCGAGDAPAAGRGTRRMPDAWVSTAYAASADAACSWPLRVRHVTSVPVLSIASDGVLAEPPEREHCQMPLGIPPMKDCASGAAPLNSAPEKSNPGCCEAHTAI